MSKNRTGNFIAGGTPQSPSLTSNNGVFDVNEVYTAVNNNAWQPSYSSTYEVSRSLRFRANASSFLSRTPVFVGNRKTWTWSGWVKRSSLSGAQVLFAAGPSSGVSPFETSFQFTDNQLQLVINGNGGIGGSAVSSSVFRDINSWYHVVGAVDMSAVGQTNKVRLFVNGVQVRTSYNGLTTTDDTQVNNTVIHRMGCASFTSALYLDGYMTEVNFVDGQSLDPSYFGYFDSNGVWQPKQYTGGYGVNGFYMPFNDFSNLYGFGNDKKPTTSIGSYATGTLTTSVSRWGGSAFSLAGGGYVFPGGLGSGYGTHNPMHNIDGKDFTIEFWYRGQASDTNFGSQDGVLTSYNYFVSKGRTNTSALGWGVRLYNDGGVAFDIFGGTGGTSGAIGYTGGSGGNPSILDNQWHHIAITRSSGTVRVFIDGTQRASGTLNFACNQTYGLAINGMWNYSDGTTLTYKVGGTMDDFRMYTGIAKYTSNFVAPTAPLPIGQTDQFWGYVSCALPFDGSNGSSLIPAWIPNYWDPNNLSATAGTTYDSMADSPTNVVTTAVDTGGVVPGNYATWDSTVAANYNNVGSMGSTIITFSEGNLVANNSASTGFAPRMQCWSTIGMYTGKWYAEFTNLSNMAVGVSKGPIITGTGNGIDCTVHYNDSGSIFAGNGASGTSFGTFPSVTTTDIVGVAFDVDAATITWFKNGVQMGGFTNLSSSGSIYDSSRPWYFSRSPGSSASSASITANFGQRPFAYTPPAGFRSLNTTNLQSLGTSTVGNAAIKANMNFDISLYPGTGIPRDVTNSGFSPDLVWIKNRSSGTFSHALFDSLRNPGLRLGTNLSETEGTGSFGNLISFNRDGFTVAPGSSDAGETCATGQSYVAWQWRVGSNQVTNTAGSISSQVKANPTTGFSIVTFTGNGSASQTVGHGLGVQPSMVLEKARNAAQNWYVYFPRVGSNGTFFEGINNTNGGNTGSTSQISFSSTVGTINNQPDHNTNGRTYIWYVFSAVPGFSAFGNYYGNGSDDGPVVNLGFRPRWLMIKRVDNTSNWEINDTTRQVTTPIFLDLSANSTNAENAVDGTTYIITANGFKIADGSSTGTKNVIGGHYVYAAFAESPFALNNRAR